MSYFDEQLDIREGEPHYAEAQYVKTHGLSLLDFDCWTHLEDILGFAVPWADYCMADGAIDCIMLDVQRGSIEHQYILQALENKHSPKTRRPVIYTVAIKDLEDDDKDIWVSSFSTEEKANKFRADAQRRLNEYGVTSMQVCMDAGVIDSNLYLSWLDDFYGAKDDSDD